MKASTFTMQLKQRLTNKLQLLRQQNVETISLFNTGKCIGAKIK